MMQNNWKRFNRHFGFDPRIFGMIGAVVVLWSAFDIITDGRFLTPRNLFNLSVQTASVAIMAMGMVFIIVMRHIDLSVGSMLGFIGMLMGVIQVNLLPELIGFGHWSIWLLTIFSGIVTGVVLGALQGGIIAYFGVPAFIVTLGGFLVWRGMAWWVTHGQTIAPLDRNYRLLGGGAEGALGAMSSWILGGIAISGLIAVIIMNRGRKISHGFPVRPIWAECTLAGVGAILISGSVLLMNAYPVPQRAAKRIYESRGLDFPAQGVDLVHGIAIPVVLVLLIAIIMTFAAKRTRFGRYVFATGGNPSAAELSGINTKLMTVRIFALMGGLASLSAVIASARLGAVSNDLGTLDELRVIAAAVIGGTVLSGGVGTIYGAILGALIMQSLQSGMAMVGMDAPLQSIVVGLVLVLSVIIDNAYQKRIKR